MWLLKISLILVDSLLKVGPGKTKKILEKSLKSHGIFSQKRCMNPERGGSLSFLTIFTFAVPELLDLILDMTENRIFTLCRMITWVVFLRMFWNFVSSLPVKRGGSLSFLTIFTFSVPELLDLIWRKIGFLPYVVW